MTGGPLAEGPAGAEATPVAATMELPRIVLAYPDGRLDSPWFRAYKRVKRSMRTKGIAATVELQPAGDVPLGASIVIAHPDLAGSAHLPVGHVVSPLDRVQADVEEQVERLLADGRLRYAPAPPRSVAVHRGPLALTGRARTGD